MVIYEAMEADEITISGGRTMGKCPYVGANVGVATGEDWVF
jgi:hypothetical protein